MPIKYRTIKLKNIQWKKDKTDGDDFATFDAYGSTFGGPPDSYGDVVDPGAFAKTIQLWNQKISSGQLLPMLWQHQYDNPIGGYASLAEDDKGLVVKDAQINVGVQKGLECYKLMKQGVINALSIGYKTMQERACDKCADADEPHNHLIEIKLYELSPVTFPANENALLTAVKSREFTQGLDAAIEFLQKIRSCSSPDELGELVSQGNREKEFAGAIRSMFQNLS